MSGFVGERPVLMDRIQLQSWIMRKLGAPSWNIALKPCHLIDSVEDAILWFMKWRGGAIRWCYDIQMVSGQVVYEYPLDAGTILDVVPPGVPGIGGGLNMFNALPFFSNMVPYGSYQESYSAGGPVSSFYQAEQYNESADRVFSQDFNWIPDNDRRVFTVTPIPRKTGTMAVQYTSQLFDISTMSIYDHDMLKRMALALAKGVLGLIRRKYSRIPGADGEQSLDGEQLVSEAKAEVDELNEEIRESGHPLPIITG